MAIPILEHGHGYRAWPFVAKDVLLYTATSIREHALPLVAHAKPTLCLNPRQACRIKRDGAIHLQGDASIAMLS